MRPQSLPTGGRRYPRPSRSSAGRGPPLGRRHYHPGFTYFVWTISPLPVPLGEGPLLPPCVAGGPPLLPASPALRCASIRLRGLRGWVHPGRDPVRLRGSPNIFRRSRSVRPTNPRRRLARPPYAPPPPKLPRRSLGKLASDFGIGCTEPPLEPRLPLATASKPYSRPISLPPSVARRIRRSSPAGGRRLFPSSPPGSVALLSSLLTVLP